MKINLNYDKKTEKIENSVKNPKNKPVKENYKIGL